MNDGSPLSSRKYHIICWYSVQCGFRQKQRSSRVGRENSCRNSLMRLPQWTWFPLFIEFLYYKIEKLSSHITLFYHNTELFYQVEYITIVFYPLCHLPSHVDPVQVLFMTQIVNIA